MFNKPLVILLFLTAAIFSQGRIELSFHFGYSNPLLEARGDNLFVDDRQYPKLYVYIDGKSPLISDNLAAKTGFNANTFFKYTFTDNGLIKGLFSLGYNLLYGSYAEVRGYTSGMRVQTFSVGAGAEINPFGHKKKFYPGIFGLFRANFIGGESYFAAGIDIFKVTTRFGYTAGLNLNYRINKRISLYLGNSYAYDNLLNRQTEETYTPDPHVIPFRDKASPNNGLVADRRIAYWSLYLGMNFYLK